MVNTTLESVTDDAEKESILTLQSDLQQLIQLTKENLDAMTKASQNVDSEPSESKNELDDEYALFMVI